MRLGASRGVIRAFRIWNSEFLIAALGAVKRRRTPLVAWFLREPTSTIARLANVQMLLHAAIRQVSFFSSWVLTPPSSRSWDLVQTRSRFPWIRHERRARRVLYHSLRRCPSGRPITAMRWSPPSSASSRPTIVRELAIESTALQLSTDRVGLDFGISQASAYGLTPGRPISYEHWLA